MTEHSHADARAQPGQPEARVENPEVRHEQSDVTLKSVLLFAGGLMLVALIVHLALWAMLIRLGKHEDRAKKSVFPLAVEERRQGPHQPPEPRLEGIDPAQRAVQGEPGEAPEEWDVHRFGWIDEKAGLAHIPVEEAMRRLVEKEAGGSARASETEPPNRSSSGRTPGGGQP
jgi:hypothetical protein